MARACWSPTRRGAAPGTSSSPREGRRPPTAAAGPSRPSGRAADTGAPTVLTDVTTLFTDAARIFGPQKGADPAAVELLARRPTTARTYPRDPETQPVGRAGGFAGGMWAGFERRSLRRRLRPRPCGFDRPYTRPQRSSSARAGSTRRRRRARSSPRSCAAPRLARLRGRGLNGDDLGDYFAGVLVASDHVAMRDAGREIAALMQQFGRRASASPARRTRRADQPMSRTVAVASAVSGR